MPENNTKEPAGSSLLEPHALAEVKQVASVLRLPLRHGSLSAGGLVSPGSGASLDFKDHRPYLPGDDPRYINWQAYGRTGTYTLKVFHHESSPFVDLLVDGSVSMHFDEQKHRRTEQLALFACESAQRAASSLAVYYQKADRIERLDAMAFSQGRAGQMPDEAFAATGGGFDFKGVQWRTGSLRVIISDLLFECPGTEALRGLTAGRGRVIVLAPFLQSEAEPDWSGQVEFRDCESGSLRTQKIHGGMIERYRKTYQRHFEIWRGAMQEAGLVCARVSADGGLMDALQQEALLRGAVEMRA